MGYVFVASAVGIALSEVGVGSPEIETVSVVLVALDLAGVAPPQPRAEKKSTGKTDRVFMLARYCSSAPSHARC